MASKLRRAPLFGLDNPLRIPSLPKYSSPPSSAATGYKFPKSLPSPSPSSPNKLPSAPESTKPSSGGSTKPGPPSPPASKTASSPGQLSTAAPADKNRSSNGDTAPSATRSSAATTAHPTAAKFSAVTQLKMTANRQSKSSMEVGVAYSQQRGARVGGASPDRGRGSPKSSLHVDFAAPGEMKEKKEKYLTAKYGAHQMALIRKRLAVEMWMFDQLQLLYPPSTDGKSEEKEVDLDELLDLEDDNKRRKFLLEHLQDCTLPLEQVQKFVDELMERAKIL